MLPAGDHHSRSLLVRRVSSWSQLTLADSFATIDDDLGIPLLPELEYEVASVTTGDGNVSTTARRRPMNVKLWVVCFILIASGVGNVILAKLQALPM